MPLPITGIGLPDQDRLIARWISTYLLRDGGGLRRPHARGSRLNRPSTGGLVSRRRLHRHVLSQFFPGSAPGQIDGENASLIHVTRIEAAVVRFDAPSAEREADPEAGASPPRCSKGRNSISEPASPPGKPPHSSWIWISTRSALPPTRDDTVLWGRVNLNAFWRRFPTTDVRTCRSPSMTIPGSPGIRVNVTPAAVAARVAESPTSAIRADTRM